MNAFSPPLRWGDLGPKLGVGRGAVSLLSLLEEPEVVGRSPSWLRMNSGALFWAGWVARGGGLGAEDGRSDSGIPA